MKTKAARILDPFSAHTGRRRPGVLRCLFPFALAALGLVAATGPALGVVIYSTYDGTDVSTNGGFYVNRQLIIPFWSGQRVAMHFTTDAQTYSLDSVELNLTCVSGNSNAFTLSLYSDASGLPGSNLGTLSNAGPIASAGNFTFGGAGLILSPNTTYWVVAEPDLASQSSFTWNTLQATQTFAYASLVTANGTSWNAWTPPSLIFGAETAIIVNATAGVLYAGLVHHPTGAASLTIQSNLLSVTGLGTNGQDGVSVTLSPKTQILEAHWQDVDPGGTVPVGSYLKELYYGTAGSVTNGLLGSWQMTKTTSSNFQMSADFSPVGVSSFTVNVYNGATLQGGLTGVSGGDLFDPEPRLTDCDGWLKNLFPGFPRGFFPPIYITYALASSIPVTHLGPAYTGDTVEVIPEHGPASGSLSSVTFLASGFTNLTFTGEHHYVPYWGVLNESLGNANLSVRSDQLIAANLGSSGQDGFAVGANPSAGLDVQWVNPDLTGALPTGASLQEQLVGSATGITNGLLGAFHMTKLGPSNNVMNMDFSPLGAPSFVAQVYNAGSLTAQATEANGVNFGNSVDFTTDFHWLGAFPYWIITIVPPLPPPPVIELGPLPNGPSGPGDVVLFMPNTPFSPWSLSSVSVLTKNLSQLTVTNETAVTLFGGALHYTRGTTSFTVNSNVLTATGLSGGGYNAGLQIQLNHAQNWSALWQNLDPGGLLAPGAYLQQQVFGTAGPVSRDLLGTLTVTKTAGSNYTLSADFTPLQVTNQTVDVYNGASLVAHVPGQPAPGPVAAAAAAPLGSQVAISPVGTESFQFTWSSGPTTVFVSGGPAVTGDRLVVTASGPPTLGYLSGIQLSSGGGLSQITLTNETTAPSRPTLSATAGPNTLTLQWTGGGVLQQSTDMIHWSAVPNAASPFNLNPTLGPSLKFYRVDFSEPADPSYGAKG
jgi:hypothetical protein